MTHNVFSGTLNPSQSIDHLLRIIRERLTCDGERRFAADGALAGDRVGRLAVVRADVGPTSAAGSSVRLDHA